MNSLPEQKQSPFWGLYMTRMKCRPNSGTRTSVARTAFLETKLAVLDASDMSSLFTRAQIEAGANIENNTSQVGDIPHGMNALSVKKHFVDILK
ncbi:hypothetical protein CEXT_533381 [Caerostris extrusa]|uniref:Uncharacterized protein n=1 Tax=Caerostris extrusa TaxID=172846 RepID=A0AAV4UTJ3_CAEEX|nr:hypothetical protein CEXT_533381 [Caerostris extrusa]